MQWILIVIYQVQRCSQTVVFPLNSTNFRFDTCADYQGLRHRIHRIHLHNREVERQVLSTTSHRLAWLHCKLRYRQVGQAIRPQPID